MNSKLLLWTKFCKSAYSTVVQTASLEILNLKIQHNELNFYTNENSFQHEILHSQRTNWKNFCQLSYFPN